MQADVWKKVEELFQAVQAQPPGKRAEFLNQACPDDPQIRREVQSLLDAAPDAASFLDSSPLSSALTAGAKLGHFEILGSLGGGGMGEVYRARDSRLKREVAIKVLPLTFARDPDRIARFEREARTASALNHPNIVHIYDIAEADGVQFIAMEYVAGKTLGELIGRKGLRLDEALKSAAQIADALAKAHSAGIIHRDLKPSNIMVTENGLVKVLDFGLAKLAEIATGEFDETPTVRAPEGPSTEKGTIVGTTAYMSPEQAEGKKVDARSDIFSFGSVLYEMVTGRRAFHGDSKLSTLSAILKDDPKPVNSITPDVPRDLEKIISHCLRKDPERRFQHMADVKTLLDELREESDSGRLTPAPAPRTRSRSWLTLGLGAVLVLLAAGAGWFLWHPKPEKTAERRLTRLTSNGVSTNPAISPDGKMLAYLSSVGGPNQDIWVQQIGGGKAIQITHEKEGASSPVFSPDGTQIAYVSNGGIYEVPALGGDPLLIRRDEFACPCGALPVGGLRYTPDGSTILFVRFIEDWFHLAHPFTVPRMGGTPVAIQPEVHFASIPIVSADGSKLLALIYRDGRREQDLKRWWIIPIPGGKLEEVAQPSLLPGETSAPYPLAWTMPEKNSRRQWIIFRRSTGDTYNLFRVAITSDGKVTSDPEQLTFTTGYSDDPSVSESGRMVFDSGTSLSTNLWSIPFDTNRARVTGDRQSLTRVEGVRDKSPSLSRDGKKVAFFSGGRLFVKDLVTGRETQLAQDMLLAMGSSPSISPDGSFVAYALFNHARTGYDIYSISTTGGVPRLICQDCGAPGGFSADNARLLTEGGGSGFSKIALVDVATGKVAVVLSDSQHHLWNPYYSWNDKWMGFLMQIGGDFEHFRIYVTPVANFVPAGPNRWIQLTSGEYHDNKEQFSPDGNTMYFTSNRDGFTCMWALRLDPKTKHPLGAPFPIQHFHGSQRIYAGISYSNDMEVNVARDKIVTNLDEFHSDIWMMELESAQ
jgi:serine/threonine protein kinase